MARKIRYEPQQDYYVVLGIAATASAEEIQRVYRQRAKQVHPDLNPGNPELAKHQFQLLNEAYDLLSNPESRAVYDHHRRLALGIKESSMFSSPIFEQTYQPRRAPFVDDDYNYEAEVWRSAWRNVLRSPSHRLVFLVILVVFVFNVLAVALGPQIQAVVKSSGTADALREQISTTRAAPTFVYIADRPTLAAPVPSQCTDIIHITSPVDGAAFNTDSFDILGTAADPDMYDYTIEIDSASSGSRWLLQMPANSPVNEGILVRGISIGNFPLGSYILRLRVQRRDQTFAPPCEVRILRKR